MLSPGVYEQLINRRLARELERLPENRKYTAAVDRAEASGVLSQYVARVVCKTIDRLQEEGRDLPQLVALVNRLVSLIVGETEDNPSALSVDERAEQLLTLLDEKDPRLALGKTARDAVRPETSLAQSSLFTGAAHEPQMVSELRKEIASADRVDMLVSFIKWSGLRLVMEELAEFDQRVRIHTSRRRAAHHHDRLYGRDGHQGCGGAVRAFQRPHQDII